MSDRAAGPAFARLARVCVNLHGCFPYQAGRLAFVRGEGAHLYTDDGRRCVDLVNAFGSVLLGHADPDVLAAVGQAVASGVPASGHVLAAELAERIAADTAPGATVAYFKTGTEAVRAAAVAVRAVRGRPLLVSAGFHGWDELWAPPRAPFEVTRAGVFDCFCLPDVLDRFLAARAREVAAAVIAPDYLHLGAQRLRRLIQSCREHDVPVIADEVKYGYRFGPGPSLRRVGAEADVYVYAKGLANGWPLACVVGPPHLLAPMKLWCSTLAYELPSLAAAQATLAQLVARNAQASIRERAARFVSEARRVLSASRLPFDLVGDGHAFQFVAGDLALERAFYQEAAAHGLLLSPGDNQLPSLAFDGAPIDEALRALRAVVEALAGRFPALLSAPLTPEARWRAAWSQMDGFPDGDEAVDPAVRRSFLAERLACGEAA